MIRKLVCSAILGMFMTGAAPAATIFSDNFNADAKGLNASLTHWTVAPGTIDVIGPGFYDWCGAGQGNCIDMNGSSFAAGKISTTLNGLVEGKTYFLTFDYGVNQNLGSTAVEALTFGLGAASYTLNIVYQAALTGSSIYSFVAASSSETLFFADTGGSPNDNGGPLLDNVVLSTVPLPAGGLLLLGALGGVAALRRRKTA